MGSISAGPEGDEGLEEKGGLDVKMGGSKAALRKWIGVPWKEARDRLAP